MFKLYRNKVLAVKGNIERVQFIEMKEDSEVDFESSDSRAMLRRLKARIRHHFFEFPSRFLDGLSSRNCATDCDSLLSNQLNTESRSM